jgi:hypothetical protein
MNYKKSGILRVSGDGGKVCQLIGSLQQEIRPSLVKITVVGFNCNQPPTIPIWMPLQPIKELEAWLAHAVNFPLNPIPLLPANRAGKADREPQAETHPPCEPQKQTPHRSGA